MSLLAKIGRQCPGSLCRSCTLSTGVIGNLYKIP